MSSQQLKRRKILFVFDHPNPNNWKDGLWKAITLIEQEPSFDVVWNNLNDQPLRENLRDIDFILGWGGFRSKVDDAIHSLSDEKIPRGLCLGGYGFPPYEGLGYNVIFYETNWSKTWFEALKKQVVHFRRLPELVHAFGTNTSIFKRTQSKRYIDFLSVGAYANWKRHELIGNKDGTRLTIGQIQQDNRQESLQIIGKLLSKDVGVIPYVAPETLADFYNNTKVVYIPAEVVGGGERAVLEAFHCGCNILVEEDNPKLQEFVLSDLDSMDEYYYKDQLIKGIRECLKY